MVQNPPAPSSGSTALRRFLQTSEMRAWISPSPKAACWAQTRPGSDQGPVPVTSGPTSDGLQTASGTSSAAASSPWKSQKPTPVFRCTHTHSPPHTPPTERIRPTSPGWVRVGDSHLSFCLALLGSVCMLNWVRFRRSLSLRRFLC